MKTLRIILAGMSVGVLLLLLGGIAAELETTLVSGLLLFGAIAAVGCATGIFVAPRLSRLTGIGNRVVNYVGYVAAFTVAVGGTVLIVNDLAADTESFREEKAVVERRIVKTRHRSHRTGRHSYSSGTPYKVYYLEVRLPGGESIELQPAYKEYVKASEGDTATVRVGRGALGMKMVDPRTFRLPKKKKARRRYGAHHHD